MRDGLARERLRLTLSAKSEDKASSRSFFASRRKLAKSQELNQHNVGKVRDFVLLFVPATSFVWKNAFMSHYFPLCTCRIRVPSSLLFSIFGGIYILACRKDIAWR